MAGGLVGEALRGRRQTIQLLKHMAHTSGPRVDHSQEAVKPIQGGKHLVLNYSASGWHPDAAAEQPPSRARYLALWS